MEKLSELIRRGAKTVDGQCYNDYIARDGDKVLCCAAGVAYYALTGELPRQTHEYGLGAENFPIDVLRESGVPAFILERNVDVVNWNDSGMDFEEIAAALESKGL